MKTESDGSTSALTSDAGAFGVDAAALAELVDGGAKPKPASPHDEGTAQDACGGSRDPSSACDNSEDAGGSRADASVGDRDGQGAASDDLVDSNLKRFGECQTYAEELVAEGELRSLAAARLADAWMVATLAEVADVAVVSATLFDSELSKLGEHELPFDLSGSFDPRLLAAGDEQGAHVLVADASTLHGFHIPPPPRGAPLSLTEGFEMALPLLDPKARRVDGRTFVVGIDVFQGCGLFARATIIEGSSPAEPTMSDCLTNFSGALRDAAVDADGVRLLMGERLMRVDAVAEFSQAELDGSRYEWQQPAVLGWVGDHGWLIAQAADGTTLVERVAKDGRSSGPASTDLRLLPLAISTPRPLDGQLWWLGYSPSSEGGVGEVVLTRLAEVAGQVSLSEPVAIAKDESEPRDVQLAWQGQALRAFWRPSERGMARHLRARIDCE